MQLPKGQMEEIIDPNNSVVGGYNERSKGRQGL